MPVGHNASEMAWRQRGPTFAVTRPNPSGAWLLLLMCVGPRANHILRNLPLQKCSIPARTMMTTCGLWPCRCPNNKGGAVALLGRRVGPSECAQVGASSLLGVLGRLFVAGPGPCTHRSAHSFCRSWRGHRQEHGVVGQPNMLPRCLQLKAWRYQSGPKSRTLTSARHNQSIPR